MGSGTIRCHHFILHQDRELSVSFSLPSDSHVDSGQQRQPERDTRHGRDSLQMTSLKNSENSTKFCSCKQFRHKSSQACSAARAINKGRRRIIKMLVLMLAVYYLCWGSWLASKMIVWWARDTDIPFTKMFYRFSIMAKHLPTIHATINPFIYCFMSANFRKL